ncbi:MAG: hypothetical protein QM654_07785 [Dysgonamonadaceae bacterium]
MILFILLGVCFRRVSRALRMIILALSVGGNYPLGFIDILALFCHQWFKIKIPDIE